MNVQSREQIRDKMIRLAAEHWRLEENEIEANFDPLVTLLFDAVAGEIESLGYRIKDIQGNLLNELASLMLPHSLLRAQPASCILAAQPVEATCLLKSETNFSTIAKTSRPDEPSKEAELNFTPIGETRLIKVALEYISIGNKVFKYASDGKKVPVHQAPAATMVQELHFTLTARAPITSLSGLQLFFDLKGHSEAGNFYFALQDADLFINDRPYRWEKGFFKQAQYEVSIRDAFDNDNNYSRKIQREIAAIYGDQFFTISEDGMPLPEVPTTPSILQNMPEKLVQEIRKTGTIYCTIKLRRPFSSDFLERLQLSVNAFPAINRKLERLFHKTEKWINIIPMQVYGSYLDVHTIEGMNGVKYRLQAANQDSTVAEGQAIIRAARVSKNSSNDIRNALKSLLEAVRDESAYFSRVSNDFISARLNEISKILTRLEDQVQLAKDEKPTFRYILLKSKNAGETVEVAYWSTAPAEAGFLKAHAGFRSVQHSLTEPNSCFSVTPALGGIETQNDYAQKQMLVRQLSSRGKIISIEDVKLLCYEIFGQKVKNVAVQKSLKIPQGSNSGITRFIDIHVSLQKGSFVPEERLYLKRQLACQLEQHASFMFPFEITIEEV